ncbi:MAG TPA: cytochrome c-type biogenesis CcmF C-terminal domain-containing protein [Bacteroidota bacterium]|nr:cytochrome c-type biogenesis CcmF C-terminal domain-containing protein [Bacteroidota bacterium]
MIGGIIIKIAFALSLLASFLYFRAQRSGRAGELRLARTSFHFAVMALMAAFATLVYLILTHRFEFTYVWNYSSTTLPLPLLLSTAYAGQEGSFMLWALYSSIIGIFLLQYSARKGYEAEVMSVFSLIISFLLLMLIVKNPFAYIWDSFPKDLIQKGAIPAGTVNAVVLDAANKIWARFPAEGKGLNPLLQNYWMVIHPQVLFMGFSSMSVPYALAVAGLIKRDYTSWIRVAIPWSVFGAMVLGTGIILGGYWAYETLGWGGFWGWDPVENSSLIPWLVCVASIHTSLTQRRSGAFVRTNFVLSLLTFVMVLYSTFLTRSGVLGETSVHSFVDPGMWVYWLLLAFIAVFVCIGFGLLLFRMKEMPKVPVEHTVFSREFALFLGASALTFVSIFVVLGTSSPIITSILKGKASAVDASYYVKTNLPLGIIITFLSGIGQLLWWKNSRKDSLLRRMALPLALAAIATLLVRSMGKEDVLILLFVFCAAFSLFANAIVAYDIYIGNPKFAGGSIAHIGIAVMCIGFVTSARYDKKETVTLEKGKTTEALGYQMTYVGYHPTEGGKYAFAVEVEKEGSKRIVAPTMYYSDFNQSLMRHPDLINYLNRDFYVAPLSLEEPTDGSEAKEFDLQKGESADVSGLNVRFVDFDFNNFQKGAMLEGKGFEIRAILEVGEGYKKQNVDLVMKNDGSGVEYVPVDWKTTDGKVYQFKLTQIEPNREDKSKSRVHFSVKPPADPSAKPRGESLVIEATVKPYINLVWVGTVTLVIGFFLTIVRRASEPASKT